MVKLRIPHLDATGLVAHSEGVRRRLFVAGLLGLPLVACGGKDDEPAVEVRLVTPPGGAGGNGGATPTPLPPPEVLLSAESVYQAGAILISVTGDVTAGSITYLDRTLPLSRGRQSLYTLVGFGTDDPPGPIRLRIDFTMTNGTTGSIEQEVTLLATQWTVDSLTFTPQQLAALTDPRVTENELELLKVFYSVQTPERLWEDGWLMPVEGPITARMGEQRSINGSPPSGHHGGTDIGAEAGTPIHATNTGRVAMARQLTVRGNMVIVDHGGGLFSGYAHMSSFAVAEGQPITKGDLVGYVGNTGLSTGAHLHWEMAQGGVLLDALRFLDGTNGF